MTRTQNFANAMSRSAERRQCPKCGRKSALVFASDDTGFGSSCRWCDYSRFTARFGDGDIDTKSDA